jgi:hypothetical protein
MIIILKSSLPFIFIKKNQVASIKSYLFLTLPDYKLILESQRISNLTNYILQHDFYHYKRQNHPLILHCIKNKAKLILYQQLTTTIN